MRSGKEPSVRLLCTEPLEGRWLLSAAAPPWAHAAAHGREGDGDDNPNALSSSPSDTRGDDDEDDEVGNPARGDAADGDRKDEVVESSGVAPATPGQSSDAELNDEGADELVSGSTPTASDLATSDSPPGAVRVVELEPADEDEADGDVDVAPAELPTAVRAAFATNYPGAKVIEAEYGLDDGEGEYDITAKFNGDVIDVTFTPGGEVIETERALTSDELPREVLDWVRAHFADATIGEASVMVEDGVQQYEVLIAAADGTQTEATLRVPGLDTPGSAPGDDGDDGEQAPGEASVNTAPPETEVAGTFGDDSVAATDPAATAAAADEATPHARSSPAAPAASNRPETPAAQVPAGAGANASQGMTAADALAAAGRAARVATALQTLAAGEPADRWLPQLAGVLGDVFTADPVGVESRLDALLARIDALAEEVGADNVRDAGGPSRLAMVAALVAASQLYRLHPRRTGAGRAVVFNDAAAGTSSWSWVLGRPSDDDDERGGRRDPASTSQARVDDPCHAARVP